MKAFFVDFRTVELGAVADNKKGKKKVN